MALGPSLLENVAGRDYKRHIFLGYHAPQVGERIVEWALACDYFSIIDITDWSIHEICIDVGVELRVSSLKRSSWYKVNT